MLCAAPLPQQYRYLYGPDYTPSRVLDWPVEYVVAVDVASAELLGELEPKYGRMVDLCIDHHPSNTDYAALTCLDGEAAACAELVAAILTAVGLPLTGKIAECIYTGLVTDTGGFRFSNTTANSMRLAADIMESGVDTAAINTRIFESKSKARVLAEAAFRPAVLRGKPHRRDAHHPCRPRRNRRHHGRAGGYGRHSAPDRRGAGGGHHQGV